MGLLGDLSAWLDNRKKVVGQNVQDLAAGLLAPQWAAQAKEDLSAHGKEMMQSPLGEGAWDRWGSVAGMLGTMEPVGKPDISKILDAMRKARDLEQSLVAKQRAVEGLRAAMRDPDTGKVYTGWTHQAAIDKIPPSDNTGAWGRLYNEWDKGTDNTGFVDTAGNFIPRSQADSQWGVLTMEDARDLLKKGRVR